MHTQQTYALIGTEASPATLTATFAGNTSAAVFAKGFKKAALDITYVPAVSNSYAAIVFEYNNEDKMVTSLTKWKQFTVAIPATTEVDIYAALGTAMGTNSGTPILVPTPNTSTGGVSYTPHISPDTDLSATWVRVKCLETTSGAAGTLYVGLSLQE